MIRDAILLVMGASEVAKPSTRAEPLDDLDDVGSTATGPVVPRPERIQTVSRPEQQGRILKVEVQEAAARLPDLLDRVRSGEDVVLSDGELEVRLVLLPPGRRVLGQDAGLFEVPEDFDEPLPDALLDAFGS